mmetsp:Transcript_23282/g.31901  ORF Transcript_23282/g.31901 Transcript_23282/m.31901 type:complete len:249 (+) Transcript_23282:63-809(+)
MSKLSNLFSSSFNDSAVDSLDSLKYSAPKEPKSKGGTVIAPMTSLVKMPAKVVPIEKPVGPPKVIASTAVRLFKVNPATNAYEAVDNGAALGCVVLGSGVVFHLLIYNAQQVQYAVVPLTSSFDYSVSQLYMSFYDHSQQRLSAMFTDANAMLAFLRCVAITILHVRSHSASSDPVEGSEVFVRTTLDPTLAEGNTDNSSLVSLSAGMSAGVSVRVSEVASAGDCPSDLLAVGGEHELARPDQVIKIR